jgi:Fe-S-cluster containining protein
LSAVYALSFHADYACRHSGACCTTDWDVPVELPVYRSLREAVTAGRLRQVASRPAEPFVVEPDRDGATEVIFSRTDEGACVFFEPSSRLCVVHRDHGPAVLPETCRHFPRVAIHDARGTFVALSHYCPTAASMLFRDDRPVAIVREPAAFPPGNYDGLSVGPEDYPPLLHPRLLMDADGYSAWEAHMVARASALTRSPESVLATLRRDAERLARWRPGAGSLRDAVTALPAALVDAAPPATLDTSLVLHAQCMAAVPEELMPPPDGDGLESAWHSLVWPTWPAFTAPLNRYIAAKAFATWTAYQGRGVRTIVVGIEAAVALVRVEAARQCRDAARPLDGTLLLEAFRAADFILNHLATGDALAEGWGRSIGEW